MGINYGFDKVALREAQVKSGEPGARAEHARPRRAEGRRWIQTRPAR